MESKQNAAAVQAPLESLAEPGQLELALEALTSPPSHHSEYAGVEAATEVEVEAWAATGSAPETAVAVEPPVAAVAVAVKEEAAVVVVAVAAVVGAVDVVVDVAVAVVAVVAWVTAGLDGPWEALGS